MYVLATSVKSCDISHKPQTLESYEKDRNERLEPREDPGAVIAEEADDLRALLIDFSTFARTDLGMTDNVLFAAPNHAGMTSKQARISRLYPRYHETTQQSDNPRSTVPRATRHSAAAGDCTASDDAARAGR